MRKDLFFGFYEGVVEDNIDPSQLGRLRIRVPFLHGVIGDTEYIPTEDLPWASSGTFICGFYDSGSFLIPQIGSYVYVSFIDGDSTKPIYFGSSLKISSVKAGSFSDENKSDDLFSGQFNTPNDSFTPKDVFKNRNISDQVTRGVIFKSPKGSTISYDDTSGAESFTITDRVGQVIHMYSPISVEDNKGNANRRGLKSALTDDQLSSPDSFVLIKTGIVSAKLTPKDLTLSVGNTTFNMIDGKLTINADAVEVNTKGFDING